MTGILNKFHVEHDTHGVRLIARSNALTQNCLADDEIDSAMRMLRDDLDACALQMKRLLKVNNSGALFEGWPSMSEVDNEAEGIGIRNTPVEQLGCSIRVDIGILEQYSQLV